MKNRKLHIIPSLLLAVLLLFGNTPKEFIHLFTDHKDTVHGFHKHGDLSFESVHHHCDFLSYALPLFIPAEPVGVCFHTAITYPQGYSKYHDHLFFKETKGGFLRGPPDSFI